MATKVRKTNATKARIAANGYRLCDALPKGEKLVDSTNSEWTLGLPIGCGGFGEIYSCGRSGDRGEYVMKLDNIDGPLFAEMNFYIRVAKQEAIESWTRERRLKFMGMPKYVASGVHDRSGRQTTAASKSADPKSARKTKRDAPTTHYRFLVMQRFGHELQTAVNERKLTPRTAADIAAKMIDVLEYIHSFGYIHADIKATNILRAQSGARSPRRSNTAADSNYYLVDFGLAERYMNTNGEHREEKPDRKRANNGTVEFRSRDAHIGLISRRSDVECLAYNLIVWLNGALPWMNCLSDANKVQQLKEKAMSDVDKFLVDCFGGKKSVPNGLNEFLTLINTTGYSSEPKYSALKSVLLNKTAKSSSVSKKNISLKSSTEDDSDDSYDSDEEVIRCSPPKRQRVLRQSPNTALNSMPLVTPIPKPGLTKTPKSKPFPRFSTPLLFCNSSDESKSTTNNTIVISDTSADTPKTVTKRRVPKKRVPQKKRIVEQTVAIDSTDTSLDTSQSPSEEIPPPVGATPQMIAIQKMLDKKKQLNNNRAANRSAPKRK